MASIDDIRVNGQQSSATTTPVIAGLNPVITWDYLDDPAAPSQVSFDIKIGTVTTNWGTAAFAGNILDRSITESGNAYEFLGHGLLRGITYYGQIRVFDVDNDATVWAQFSFITNQLPFITNYYLSPAAPDTTDNIDLIYTYNDPDGHDQSGTKIRWFKNNLPQPSYDDLCTLASNATNPTDSWTAKIIPSDGLEYGALVETQAVVVSIVDTGIENVNILPVDANVDDILQIEYDIAETEYVSPSGIIVIEWYVNDVLIPDSNTSLIRPELDPGDIVYAIVKLTDGGTILSQARSHEHIILDVPWYVFNLEISGLVEASALVDLAPILSWNVHKTTAGANERPDHVRVLVTKTPSLDGPIHDTGLITYTANSYAIPSGVLKRGQHYFIHVVASDETSTDDIDFNLYQTKEVATAGSSWSMLVNNTTGWTIEFKVAVLGSDSETAEPNLGIYIHDGTYFCTITLAWRTITFLSGTSVSYAIPSSEPNLAVARTFRVAAQGTNLKILMDNKLIIDIEGGFSHESKLKFIEYGDIDSKNTNYGIFRFFRYSTNGPYRFGSNLSDENTFYFAPMGSLEGGSIDYVHTNIISWLPDNTDESAKLIEFNENSEFIRLPTVTKNFSPITSIYIDENRNKFIGTANGVTAIYGERHDPDYSFDTTGNVSITPEDFDRVSNVPASKLALAEANIQNGWVTINTTYRALGDIDTNTIIAVDDEYNPYINPIVSRAIHYYSQRTHGHAWFDKVDNEKGWQAAFSFQLDKLEADDFEETNIDKSGFGVYVNDGTYQEIVYFYDDRIRLFYANVYVPIITTRARDYAIVGKGNSLKIYQKLRTSAGSYQLLVDASGLFTTPSTKTANSTKPKIVVDNTGIYHAVWQDDTNTRSQIFYSSHDGANWSSPEQITTDTQFNMRNPDIDIDSLGRSWVAYEDTSWGQTEITVSVRDNSGWNPKTRLTNFASDKGEPSIKVDSNDNVHVVWEDNRNGHWEIFAAEWDSSSQAWTSSSQFGSDNLIVTSSEDEPYIGDSPTDYRNPELSFGNETIWLVYEAHLLDENESMIYLGFRQVGHSYWICSGSTIVNDDGEVLGFGTSILLSPINRKCVNPSIAVNSSRYTIVVVWEDQTEPVTQIWGTSRTTVGVELVDATQLTSRSADCIRPDVGFIGTQAVIVFETENIIRIVRYNSSVSTFYGSATGESDIFIETDISKLISNPAIPQLTASASFRVVYDFVSERDPYSLSTLEYPEFRMIGEALVSHAPESAYSATTETSTINEGSVSTVDTKEFAFGDFSENVGMLAHWRNIEMYFSYDTRPFSRSKYNSSTVNGWLDNRVNDLFVDTFGNLVVATFGGLYYYNVFTATLTVIEGHTEDFVDGTACSAQLGKCLLYRKLTTAIKWGGNGIWYVGTTTGVRYSRTAGRVWDKLSDSAVGALVVNDIAINTLGEAVVGTNNGVYVLHPDKDAVVVATLPDQNARAVAVDENNIIWVGTNSGLFRVENYSNILSFGINQGMRSSHVNDIVIVNKNLRYLATATGVERMYGMRFTSFNVHTTEILNDNISTLQWDGNTQSLWVGSLYKLHEIVFKDPIHDIISDEVTAYDNTDISTEQVYDTSTYVVLDFDKIQPDPNNPIVITNESATVYINKNKIDFGYLIGEGGDSVLFLTDLLVNDQVEIEASNRFIKIHDFNQKNIEISVRGQQRRSITKMDRTSRRQLLLLSGLDKPGILLFTEQSIGLPFTTILLDREAPIGCLKKLDTLTRTRLRFKILAYDTLSGLDGYILSNYENFTTDGETPQEFQQMSTIVEHDIGGSITNVFNSLTFPSTVTIGAVTHNVGTGSVLGTWTNESVGSRPRYMYAATSSPVIIFRFDPEKGDIDEQWTAIQAIDSLDANREVTGMRGINNVLFVTTGTETLGGFGTVYLTIDGLEFQLIGTVTGSYARGIAGGPDGTVYIGSSDGDIYTYKDGIFQKPIQLENIGEAVYSLEVFNNTLVVGTGNKGRVYIIRLDTMDNLIVFDGTETAIENIHIKDASLTTDPKEAFLFASANDSTTIYRSDMDSFDFVKSYNSFNKDINKIKSVDTSVLTEPGTESTGTITVAIIGENIFKFTSPAWEYVYSHSENINDFIQYESNGVDGIWIISNSKVTKWTAVLSSKTVFLKLRDKAGNVSSAPISGEENICPNANTTICCDYAYSINIADLKGFINENRIVDISEYGEVQFSYDSPNGRLFYSADQIDQEIGIYTSEIFNGSNELVSWKSITWVSTEPTGTSIHLQIRGGVTEDDTEEEDWSANLVKNSDGIVTIEHVTDQYLQFRAILTSSVRDTSPTLTSVTIRNITAQASHFFTTNFALPSRPIKGLLTANTFVPVTADIVFGINTNNSTDFGDYQIIESNRIFTTTQNQFGTNLRVGAKLLSPGIPQLQPSDSPGDPYDASSYICTISFAYSNIESTPVTYHFRVRFYNDAFRTQLIHTFYSGNDQTGWEHSDGGDNIFPATGVPFSSGETRNISFTPGDLVEQNQKWYIWIQAFDVSDPSFPETISDNESFICSACNITNESALVAEYYNTSPTSYSVMPDFGGLTPTQVLLDTHINFLETPGSWITSQGTDLGSDFVDGFAARWRGRIQAPISGTYTFYLNSDDGSLLFIDRTLVVDNDGLTDYSTQTSGSVYLTEGFHDIELQFFHHTGNAGIVLQWATPGDSSPTVVPANRLYHAVASEYCEDINTPRLLNFALLFELENGEFVKVNLEN